MDMAVNERSSQIVSHVKKIANDASSKFTAACGEVQRKAVPRIDLYGKDAVSRVAEITGSMRKACDEYYASLQSLVIELDMQCRPLIDEGLSVDSIYEVYKTIKWLNEESEIESQYNASVNSTDYGNVASTTYIPSISNKMIQEFWHTKFTMCDGSDEVLAREAEKDAEKRRREAQAKQMVSDMIAKERDELSVEDGEPFCDSGEDNPALVTLRDKKSTLKKQLRKLNTEYNREQKEYEEKISAINAEADVAKAEIKKAGLFAGKKRSAARGRYNALCQDAEVLTAMHQPVADAYNAKKKKLETLIGSCDDKLSVFTAKPGDVLKLGIDPLSENKKPIEWIVIHENSEKIYLLSKYILGYGTFKKNDSKKMCYTAWLKAFEKKAFTEAEKKIFSKNPDKSKDAASYVFAYRFGDAKKYLTPYLSAKLSDDLSSDLNNMLSGDTFKDMDVKSTIISASKGYWLRSRDEMNEYSVYCVSKNDANKWGVDHIRMVTNDEYTRGIRPGIIIDRKKLPEFADSINVSDNVADFVEIQLPDENALRQSLTEKYAVVEASEDKKLKVLKTTVITAAVVVLTCVLGVVFATTSSKSNAYKNAMQYLEENEFALAIEAFEELGNYKNSADMLTEATYLNGLYELECGNFNEAKEIFKNIENYKDSAQLVYEADYLKAKNYMEDEKYNSAANFFEDIPDYKDSSELYKECKYLCAMEEIEDGDYEDAKEHLAELSGYKDADKYLNGFVYIPVGIIHGNKKNVNIISLTEDGKMTAFTMGGYSFSFDENGVMSGYNVNGKEYYFVYAQDGSAVSYCREDNAPMSEYDIYGNRKADYKGTDTAVPIADYEIDDRYNSVTGSRVNKYDENGNIISVHIDLPEAKDSYLRFTLKYEYQCMPELDTELYMKNIRMIIDIV